MSGNAGQGASAVTLDAKAAGRDAEGPLGKAGVQSMGSLRVKHD